MTAAIFALLGVVVGGVLNGAVSYTLEARREGKAVRAAARLLHADLSAARTSLALAAVNRDWGPLRIAPGPLSSWERHHELLAARFPNEGWFDVVLAFQAV